MAQLKVLTYDTRQPPINQLIERFGGDGVYVFLSRTNFKDNFSCTFKVVKENAVVAEECKDEGSLLTHFKRFDNFIKQGLVINVACLHEHGRTLLQERMKHITSGLVITVSSFE